MDIKQRQHFQDMELARKKIIAQSGAQVGRGNQQLQESESVDSGNIGTRRPGGRLDMRDGSLAAQGSDYSREYAESRARLMAGRVVASGSENGHGIERYEKALPKQYQEKLAEVRQKYHDSKKLAGQTKTIAKSITPGNFTSLISNINIFSDWAYAAALLVAILKDLSDFIGIGSFPAIGTVVTICCSIFISFMMILGNVMHADEHDRTIFQSYILKRWGVLLVATILEMIFVVDFLPMETIAVLLIYTFALAARRQRKDAQDEVAKI